MNFINTSKDSSTAPRNFKISGSNSPDDGFNLFAFATGTRRRCFAYRLALCQPPHASGIGRCRFLRWSLDIYSCLDSTNKLRHSSNQRLDIGNSQRNDSCLNYFSLSSNLEQLSENNPKHTCVSHSALRSLPAWSHSGESSWGQPNTQSLHCHCCRRRPTCKTFAGHYCLIWFSVCWRIGMLLLVLI